MSPIEQVLATAKIIALSGHTPTLALVKSRLSNKLPMPLIIQGLQQFKAMPKSQWHAISDPLAAQTATCEDNNNDPSIDLQQLLAHLNQLQAQVSALTLRVNTLEAMASATQLPKAKF